MICLPRRSPGEGGFVDRIGDLLIREHAGNFRECWGMRPQNAAASGQLVSIGRQNQFVGKHSIDLQNMAQHTLCK